MTYDFTFSLTGPVALVTGSSRGLGRAIALAFGKRGAKVAFNYKNDEASAQATFDEFTRAGGEVVDSSDLSSGGSSAHPEPNRPPLLKVIADDDGTLRLEID